MPGRWFNRTLLSASVLLLSLGPASVRAQDVVFSGKVTTESGQPLPGANVAIPELGVGSVASVDGHYSFTIAQSRVGGRTVNVVARYIGYKPKRLPVTITGGRVEHDFALERDVLNLQEVVVTGTSDAMSKLKTPFTVNTVDNTAIKETPAVSPIASLDGKIPG